MIPSRSILCGTSLLAAAVFFCATSVFAADDDNERVEAATIKSKQAEAAYVKALLELERLKSQIKVDKLEARLAKVKEYLTSKGIQDEDAGYIRKWLVIGPIAVGDKVDDHDEASCKALLDSDYFDIKKHPKENDTAAVRDAKLTWKAVEASDYFLDLAKFAEDAGGEAEHAAFVGVVYLTCEEEIPNVKLSIGSDDDSVWRLNGVEAIRVYEGRAIGRDQNQSEELTLKKGINVLTFTVLNGEGDCAAAARFLNSDGKAIENIGVSLEPPQP